MWNKITSPLVLEALLYLVVGIVYLRTSRRGATFRLLPKRVAQCVIWPWLLVADFVRDMKKLGA